MQVTILNNDDGNWVRVYNGPGDAVYEGEGISYGDLLRKLGIEVHEYTVSEHWFDTNRHILPDAVGLRKPGSKEDALHLLFEGLGLRIKSMEAKVLPNDDMVYDIELDSRTYNREGITERDLDHAIAQWRGNYKIPSDIKIRITRSL